jgi:hypothetical protein
VTEPPTTCQKPDTARGRRLSRWALVGDYRELARTRCIQVSSNWRTCWDLGFIYRRRSKQGTNIWKAVEGLHKESAECLRNVSLVLQSPCRGNEKGVIIPEINGHSYLGRQLQHHLIWMDVESLYIRQLPMKSR